VENTREIERSTRGKRSEEKIEERASDSNIFCN
jgi:hypothetical protein